MIFLLTAALIPFKEEERQQEYIDSIVRITNQANELNVEAGSNPVIMIVESTQPNTANTFLDKYVERYQICYTNTNNPHLRNKGVNEFVSIAAALEYFAKGNYIHPDECVLKLTGRYQLEDLEFAKTAINLIEIEKTHDVVAYHHPDGQIVTGCMAMSAKALYEFCISVDYNSIEKNMINIEQVCAYWAKTKRTNFVSRLGVVGKCAQGRPFRW